MTIQLTNIKNFPQLIKYLEDELDWPCQEYGFDEITFKYTPAELGIKDEDSAQIRQIHQLRPFYQGQPWGIFFIEFEKKRVPIALLRRVLSHLVIKKRASANGAEKAVWNMDNLLFISAFGDASTDTREIAFAHFHQEDGDLPTLKVLGWDGADTVLKMEFVDQELHEKLHWPKDPKNVGAWQSTWSSAFIHKPGFVIKTTEALADRLAELARGIRDAATTLMGHESEKGQLRQLYKAFQTALIHDLSEADFADTYAQTITYGLLTAAISRTDMNAGVYGTALVAQNVTEMVPITNPFLKEMLETFLHAGNQKGGIQFDELGIQDVVDLLRGEETDLPAILRDFNNKAPGEDPVIRFYEHFLSAYNKKLKIQRGVFYTPQPVVSYIVRSVHELLQKEFSLEDGLADTTTWAEMEKRIPGLKRPETAAPDSPFVMILDPATGTATFLVEVIDVVFKTLTEKWERQHLNKSAQNDAWNEYIPNHLLPRIYGFELMMAPFAIAHMKVGLKLFETGYKFGSNERVRIFLTNSLEEPSQLAEQNVASLFQALGNEAKAVDEIKRKNVFTVIIGNPPYSLTSANMKPEHRALVERYKFMNGERIHERGALQLEKILNDDYVKFISKSQSIITRTGIGLIGLITNHSFLDNPTMRGLRDNLKSSFEQAFFMDLGGSAKKATIEIDENVFDIQQGVAINFLIKNRFQKARNYHYCRLLGTREAKYHLLSFSNILNSNWLPLNPTLPFLLFITTNNNLQAEYENFIRIEDIFVLKSIGLFTSKDSLVIDQKKEDLEQKVRFFQHSILSDNELCNVVGIKAKKAWNVTKSRKQLRSITDISSHILNFQHRPFDSKYIFYDRSLVWSMAWPVNRNMLSGNNLALTVSRQLATLPWNHIFCSNTIVELCYITNKTKEGNHVFPLYIRPDNGNESPSLLSQQDSESNFNLKFLEKLALTLGIPTSNYFLIFHTISPEKIFHYLYAIFHSPIYRKRYAEFLKRDFPRLPITSNLELFHALSTLGSQLVALHLLEALVLNAPIAHFTGNGDNSVQSGYPKYESNKVLINPTQGFEGVSQDIWEFFIGGYQVCRKWLKDRRGRQLSEEDIPHYQKIIVTLKETIRIMGEIDQVIEDHGGWPIK